MSRAFDPHSSERSVFDALVDARTQYGAKKLILEDQDRNPLSYTDLIRAAFALGRKIAAMTKPGENVGVMLPASSAAVVTFFALHAFGRVPTMLNFTSGIRNLKAACELAGVRTVLTSHRFIEQGKLHVELFGRGTAWLDTGTHDSLIEAAQFVHVLENRTGLKIACIEEIAYKQGWIDRAGLEANIAKLGKSAYGQYLKRLLA